MNNLADFSKILEDPKSMEQLQNMASALFSGMGDKSGSESAPQPPSNSSLDGFGDLLDIGTLMRIGTALKNSGNDNRSNLLLSLKPHLSSDRQSRVDKAVKILKLVSLVPILREQGILNL